MSTFLRGQSQIMGIKPLFPVKPLLSISSPDFEQIWKEVKWDTKRVNSTLDLFSRFCKDDLDILPYDSTSNDINSNSGGGINHSQLMSNHRLMALLKSIAIVGTDSDDFNNMDFFTRNDLCVIMTGIPYIDKKNFLRLMCLLDRSTPHTTTSPAGISRLKLVFSYYDWGWKGYLDEFDWKRLRSDILNLTYYGKLYDTNNNSHDLKSRLNGTNKKGGPMPETLEEGLKQLSQEISIRSLKSTNSGSKLLKNDSIHISINASSTSNMNSNGGHSEYSYFDNNHNFTASVPYSVQNNDLIIDFPLFIKLVEYRIIKGTSQILRIELPGRDQEEFIARSILINGGSIFLDNYKNDNAHYSPDKSSKASIYNPISSSAQNIKSEMNSPSKINNVENEELDNIEKKKQIITEQIQELDNELNSLKISIKNSHLPSNSLGIDISNLNGDTTSKSAMESIFGPPPEDLHGIFCDQPNDQQDLAFSSIVVPSSSTPIRKSRSIRSNAIPITPITKNDSISEHAHDSNSFIAERSSTNDFPNNVNNTELAGPPILL
ncbi:hypothetical protein [Cryptosporidium parvum Iowa II]|uniref:Uncharacterized protein n=2 Tax=Cryptosporidium parvum TaxID=5807 RepID=Q5CU95_CRYPI|nr:hypothetical protein [Cryptosporidium parvum Iowa II]EAK88975.1 hypothetical protein cgd3_3710 [Cryptosporidium parvum Iowa II]QOY42723.1 Uncharacterized protein CPATCC_0034720 [Cryptosporidium parvum]WKS77121.1 hypothetical protein CPCDC_3g3710 [Cryptosporidium sp. 43IA8]WRK31612.1 Uncharacterized protein cpbgf_3003710 [Cryptosporidium parvum]|eukprot:QOY42723.1 hypothetical protein CPATCC_001395 [Cryptosporidium parvum]